MEQKISFIMMGKKSVAPAPFWRAALAWWWGHAHGPHGVSGGGWGAIGPMWGALCPPYKPLQCQFLPVFCLFFALCPTTGPVHAPQAM